MAADTTSILLLVLTLASGWSLVQGHGRLLNPPGRSTMWRFGYNSTINYDDNALNCGGYDNQWNANDGKCGVCGDPYEQRSPRDNELLGKYYTGEIVATYRRGQTVDVDVQLTINHFGWFRFSVCSYTPSDLTSGTEVTQKCLDEHVLEMADGSGTKFQIPGNAPSQEVFNLHFILPEDVQCSRCFLQWHWYTASNWGVCANGTGADGCGSQEVFRSCADVAIM